MKKSLLFTLVIIAIVLGGWFSSRLEAPVVDKPASAQVYGVQAPKVDSERLFSHIKELNFQRYTNTERQRAQKYIINKLSEVGLQPQLQEFEGGVNVWAQREGTDASAGVIVVGAHYDTVPKSPGADDNSTGVATVLEVARLLVQSETARGLRVVFFDSEERGLLGSLAFNGGDVGLDDVRGVVVLDMIGFACRVAGCQRLPQGLPVSGVSDKGDFLAVVGDTEHLPLLRVFEGVKGVGLPAVFGLPVPLKGVLIPDVLRSDHAPFWLNGIGAVLVTDTANLRNPNYHQFSDKPESLDRDFFVGSAQLVVNAVTELLEGKGSLETVRN